MTNLVYRMAHNCEKEQKLVQQLCGSTAAAIFYKNVLRTSAVSSTNFGSKKAISYAVGFRQSKTALFDWTFFRLDSSGPSSYHQST